MLFNPPECPFDGFLVSQGLDAKYFKDVIVIRNNLNLHAVNQQGGSRLIAIAIRRVPYGKGDVKLKDIQPFKIA